MSYEINNINADCYEGTNCLINKFDIRDDNKLKSLEADITLGKSVQLLNSDESVKLDVDYYKYIHKFLFEDIYDWAGHFRTIDISKKGTVFAKYQNIETLLSKAINRLEEQSFFKGLNKDDLIESVLDFYLVTNHIHPFREGNGRTQRIFISQLLKYSNHEIDFFEIDSDELIIATIQASGGVKDNLINIFKKIIH